MICKKYLGFFVAKKKESLRGKMQKGVYLYFMAILKK